MKIFKELIMKDFGWKLLSVAIATAMWFLVININQPVDNRNFTKTIVLENMQVLTDRGLTIANAEELESTRITIKVKSQRTALDRLSQNTDWLKASVDVTALEYAKSGDKVTLQVDVSMPGMYSGYTIVSKSPTIIEAHVEELASKKMKIDVAINGETESTMLSEAKLSQDVVTVSGAASAVARVSFVRGYVNVQDIALGAQLQVSLIPYDKDGAPVKGVVLDTNTITVGYDIYSTKFLSVQVNLLGEVMEGYELGETTTIPAQVEVMGAEDALQNLMYLQLTPIDISGQTSTITQNYPISDYLPEGVFVRDVSHVQVSVEILAKKGKTLLLDADKIKLENEDPTKNYTLKGTAIIPLHGEDELLEGITSYNIIATVDVQGMSAGEHRLLVNPQLPSGVTAGYGYIAVLVEDVVEINDDPSSGED